MSVVERAILLAARGHADDRWGYLPYVAHLALVANRVQSLAEADEQTVAAAWLHDLYEDHPDYADELEEHFPNEWPTLQLLARAPGVTYEAYVQAIIDSNDRQAILVKRADLLVNLENNPRKKGLADRYRGALRLFDE